MRRRQTADRQRERRPRHHHQDVSSAEESLPEQGLSREHKGQDSEHQQAICEADRERQGGEECGVRGQGEQHPG